MTECPQVCFPSLGEDSARDFASRYAQLSNRGKLVLDRLLFLLPSFFKTSRTSPFPPSFLFSICEAFQHTGTVAPADEEDESSVLPSVLSKLREWRHLDPEHLFSSAGIYKLALDLAAIQDEVSASSSICASASESHCRLRMKWIRSDSPNENQIQDLQVPPTPLSHRSALDSAHECAYALSDRDVCRSDATYASCQARGGLGTLDSEDASAVGSRPRHSSSGFRSGCLACRHPRIFAPSTPSPRKLSLEERQRTPFTSLNRCNTVNAIVLSPTHPKPSVQRTATKTLKRETPTPSRPRSVASGPATDENEPPLSKPNALHGIGISNSRSHAHFSRKSNDASSRTLPFAASASVQRSSHVLNRIREGDKHTSSHRLASADLWLEMARLNRGSASPIDLQPSPMRGLRGSCLPEPVRTSPHWFESVVNGSRRSSNADASQSSKRVSFSSQFPATTASMDVALAAPLLPLAASPARTRAGPFPNPILGTPRPSSISTPRMPGKTTRRDHHSVSIGTHKKTRSETFVGSLSSTTRPTPISRR